jgi:hypothetical protein
VVGFFVCAAALLAGCTEFDVIRIQDIAPTATFRDFSALSCEQLKSEKTRIEAEFKPLLGSFRPGTRAEIGRLKREAIDVDTRSHELGCLNAPVVVPYPTLHGRPVN